MTLMLIAPLLLLALAILPGPISRLVGVRFAATLLFSTGFVVLPVLVGLTWRAVLMGGCDAMLLLAGAALTKRMGFSRHVSKVWMKRLAIAASGFLSLAFGVLALMLTALTGAARFRSKSACS